MDEFERLYVLKYMLYCPDVEQSILSMMKLLQEDEQLSFRGTNCTLIMPDDCTLYEKSINNLLHLSDFGREEKHIVMITTRSQTNQEHMELELIENDIEKDENPSEQMNIIEQDSIIPINNISSPILSSDVSRIKKPKRLSSNYL